MRKILALIVVAAGPAALALGFFGMTGIGSRSTQEAASIIQPIPKVAIPEPESDWSISQPSTNQMDGVVTKFVIADGFAKLKTHSKLLIEVGCNETDSEVITIKIKGLQASLKSMKS